MKLTESTLNKAINESVKRILKEFNQERFNQEANRMAENDEIAKQFIEFIEKYKGGVLLQLIVDYESGNEFGEPVSPIPTLIGEFEETYGQQLEPDTKQRIKSAYNEWWNYAEPQLMPDGMNESKLIKTIVEGVMDKIGGGVHPNKQMDLFMNQDEVDQYHEDSDNAMFGAMFNALSECGWSITGEKQIKGGVRYNCCPDKPFKACSQKEVIERVKEMSPSPQNLKFVNVRKQYAPEITYLGIIINDIVE